MVEFAIVLLVFSLLVAGGLELAMAAYNGHATGQAAKAGAVEWSESLAKANYDAGSGDFTLANGLGDHADPGLFRRPACTSATDYDDGLPDGAVDANEISITQGGDKIYLYNPLPIDISNCAGKDDNGTPTDTSDDTRSRVSVLVAGRGKRGDANYLPGLPRLNRSIYAMYEKTCLQTGVAVSCSSAHDVVLLKLPGWLANDDTMNLVAYDNGSLEYLPAFALQCQAHGVPGWGDCDSEASPADVCWKNTTAVALACGVQVQYRYRHVFESLVLMGMEGAPDTVPMAEQPYFNSTAPVAGVLGSELRETSDPATSGIGATLKARKDFLGCYEAAALSSGSTIVTINTTINQLCSYPPVTLP